jgi:hypothetical protein
MGRCTSWITDIFDKAETLDEMVAVMGGDAPTHEASPLRGHVRPDALTILESSCSQTGVVVGVQWLIGFLNRLEKRVAALETELAPPHQTCKCPRCRDSILEGVNTGSYPDFGFVGASSTKCTAALRGAVTVELGSTTPTITSAERE